MKEFLKRLIGRGSRREAGESDSVSGEEITYQGLIVRAMPQRSGDQWRLAGVIIKPIEVQSSAEVELERRFVRADSFSSREQAESFAIRKGQQIIDEQGDRLFADGEVTGRA